MGKTGQFAEKQTAAVQSAGFEKFKTVMSKVNSVINLVGVWLGLTAACLLLMFCSRKAMYPWAISIFTLALPVLLLVSNVYPS